jgi:hypothetical protein
MFGAASNMCCLEHWGADWDFCGKKAIGGMVHSELASDRSRVASVCRVHYTFAKLEAWGICQGEKGVGGLLGRFGSTL